MLKVVKLQSRLSFEFAAEQCNTVISARMVHKNDPDLLNDLLND